jgi:hypothetical protein
MIKSRLLLLAERLEKIAAKPPKNRKFDLRVWFRKPNTPSFFDPYFCGTTCCAVGEATLIPRFKELGLKYKNRVGPVFKRYEGFHAAEKFFGISNLEAIKLFTTAFYLDGSETKPDDVASRIRAFVRTGKILAA